MLPVLFPKHLLWMVPPLLCLFGGGGGGAATPKPIPPAAPPAPPGPSAATAATQKLIRDIASQRSYQTTVLTGHRRDPLVPGSMPWSLLSDNYVAPSSYVPQNQNTLPRDPNQTPGGATGGGANGPGPGGSLATPGVSSGGGFAGVGGNNIAVINNTGITHSDSVVYGGEDIGSTYGTDVVINGGFPQNPGVDRWQVNDQNLGF